MDITSLRKPRAENAREEQHWPPQQGHGSGEPAGGASATCNFTWCSPSLKTQSLRHARSCSKSAGCGLPTLHFGCPRKNRELKNGSGPPNLGLQMNINQGKRAQEGEQQKTGACTRMLQKQPKRGASPLSALHVSMLLLPMAFRRVQVRPLLLQRLQRGADLSQQRVRHAGHSGQNVCLAGQGSTKANPKCSSKF